MYLTRMELDVRKPETMKAMVSPNLFHGAVECAFPGERSRHLWRIDSLRSQQFLMLLSEEVPDLSRAVRQFGQEDSKAETKNYLPLLNRINEKTVWRFRLVANPAVTIKETHRPVSHVTIGYQKKWLMDRAEKNGFLLNDESFDVIWRKRYSFLKADRNRVQFTAVAFEGILTVSDAEKFKEILIHGVGRERAYGMGMLTVVGV